MIVLDASALLDWLLQSRRGLLIAERVSAAGDDLVAPQLIDLEVAQVLRRYVASGTLLPDRGRGALDDLLDLRLQRYPHVPLLSRIWELRDNFTAYDAVYVALAEALGAPLLTCDAKLVGAPGHAAEVELVS